jgi:hypothetical protein
MNAQEGRERYQASRGVKLRSARRNNDFTLGAERQTLLGLVAFDVKHSDGVEDFFTGCPKREPSARPHRLVPVSAPKNGAERVRWVSGSGSASFSTGVALASGLWHTSCKLGVGEMVRITAIEMANQANIDPKSFRQALREEDFVWHKPNDRWTVELGSDHHVAMIGVLRTFKLKH